METKIVEYLRPRKDDLMWKQFIEDGYHNQPGQSLVGKTRMVDYIWYGGHFLIGMRGPREDAVKILKEIIEFCDKSVRFEIGQLEVKRLNI